VGETQRGAGTEGQGEGRSEGRREGGKEGGREMERARERQRDRHTTSRKRARGGERARERESERARVHLPEDAMSNLKWCHKKQEGMTAKKKTDSSKQSKSVACCSVVTPRCRHTGLLQSGLTTINLFLIRLTLYEKYFYCKSLGKCDRRSNRLLPLRLVDQAKVKLQSRP